MCHRTNGSDVIPMIETDIGGFGIGSDITWQGYAVVGCRLLPTLEELAGWRVPGGRRNRILDQPGWVGLQAVVIASRLGV